jgi:hypothetical protein
VFSSGTVTATGPTNYVLGTTVSTTGLTLDVTNYVPIAFPLPPGQVFTGAGSVSNFVQNQSVIGFLAALAQAAGTATSASGAASISLP